MYKIKESILLPYSANQMFELVTDIEEYPDFIPWCRKSSIHCRNKNSIQASITANLYGISWDFVTRNIHKFPNLIQLELVDGPFSIFTGQWQFQDIDYRVCNVTFTIEYAFSNKILELAIGSIFHSISRNIINNFKKRAGFKYDR